jgi:hypothetical protein
MKSRKGGARRPHRARGTEPKRKLRFFRFETASLEARRPRRGVRLALPEG